jgi:haloacetate dehalogenase
VTVDREDIQSSRRKATPQLLALWGEKGTVGKLFNVLDLWRQESENVSGDALPCSHLIPEEVPGPLLQALDRFLVA